MNSGNRHINVQAADNVVKGNIQLARYFDSDTVVNLAVVEGRRLSMTT